jgi:hypothetical protein
VLHFLSGAVCVNFRVTREIDVEDAKPGTVRVYDYYQTEFSVSKSYTLPPNDECLSILSPQPIDDLIINIEDEIFDYMELQPVAVTTDAPGPNNADMEGLIDALNEFP